METRKLAGLFFSTLLLVGMNLQAAETKTAPQTTAPAAKVTATTAKLSQKEAKKQCLKENAKQKGQELKDCIKTKQSNG